MAGKGSCGPLTVSERDRVLDALGVAVFSDGLSTTRELAARLGLHRHSIPGLLRKLYARSAKDSPSIVDLRNTVLRRLERQYARSVLIYEAATAQDDTRGRTDAVRAGIDALRAVGRIAGLETLAPPADGNQPKFKITFENWSDNAPPALLKRLDQLQAESAPSEIPQ